MKPRHIVVVGSGIAGLVAALRLSVQYDVTVITKNELSESNTRWAQGGIAAVMFPDDRVEDHIHDTLAAGAGLCDPAAVRVLCEEGPARIRDLIALGVSFDQANGQLARGLEAAHSYPRILHAGGDSTGHSIEMALVHAVRSNPRIHVREHCFAADLLLRGGAVHGIELVGPGNSAEIVDADMVLLASGGAGQLYLHTTNPLGATGDGTALALRAGAHLADLEFYQFHPTALAIDGDTFLISEAVRGEGAVLLDSQGDRFMRMLHPAAELAPRDVLARSIALQMSSQEGQPVFLDATKVEQDKGSGFLARRFPTISAACKQRGLDWTRQPIPVTPAAHYWMGGIRADLSGRTSIPGLLAIGETACTGVHGANRLASNSLLESLVFAWRAADLVLTDIEAALSPAAFANDTVIILNSAADKHPSGKPLPSRLHLQELMWSAAGIERSGSDLKDALGCLWATTFAASDISSREDRNLLQLGQSIARAALVREESRGSHYREDFPDTSDIWAHSQVYCSCVIDAVSLP